MNQEQKAIYQQLQLVILGIAIGVVGFVIHHDELLWVGLAVLAYGLLRAWFIAKMIQKAKDD